MGLTKSPKFARRHETPSRCGSYWTIVSETDTNDDDDADAETSSGGNHIRPTFVPSPSLFDLKARGSLILVITAVRLRRVSLLVRDFHPHARNKNLLLSTCRHASFNCFTR